MTPDDRPSSAGARLLVSIVLRQMGARSADDLDGVIQEMLTSAWPTPLAQNQ
jgi:hypothetical protein